MASYAEQITYLAEAFLEAAHERIDSGGHDVDIDTLIDYFAKFIRRLEEIKNGEY